MIHMTLALSKWSCSCRLPENSLLLPCAQDKLELEGKVFRE